MTLLTGLPILSACGLLSDDCSVSRQAAAPGGGLGCSAARSERTVLFSGDDYPRLWTGEAARRAPNIDATALNRPPPPQTGGASPAAIGYIGTLRVAYPDDPAVQNKDITQIRAAGGGLFDPEERVNVSFEHASLDYFLKQLLGGALGVNYIAPNNLGGSVTFHTEQPLPKSQVLAVVRDVLGRNGLGMIYLNGVYQIGSTEDLKQIAAADQVGAEKSARVVRVRKGSAAEVVSLAGQLVSSDVSLAATNADDAVLVRASAANIDVASAMIRTLVEDGVGVDKMEIIHVRQASPDVIASQVESFYQGRLGKKQDLTLVPLGPQQALLVGTHDVRLLAGLRSLVEQLDHVSSTQASVRIIQLTYVSAADVTQQLSAIFGAQQGSAPGFRPGRGPGPGFGPGPGPGPEPEFPAYPSSGGSGASGGSDASPYGGLGSSAQSAKISQSGGPSANSGLTNALGGSDSSAGPSSSPSGKRGRAAASGLKGAIQAAALSGSDASGAGVKFIADTRDNAVMVYSTYDTFLHVKQVLKTIDVPQAQVVIEATIADVNLNDQLQYGVQWYFSGHGLTIGNAGDAQPTGSGNPAAFASFGTSLGGVSANVLLNALQAITTVKVISSPYLTVVDGKEARLVIGNQIPYTTTTQNSSSNGTTTITNAITTLDTGVILDVTPKILSNNTVDLSIDQEVTQPEAGESNGTTNPTIQTRSVKSNILAQSGHTIVLGGMIQESSNRTESGTPVAQSVPLLGNLFKTKSDTAARTELLVMITPRVVRQSAQLESVTRLLRDQLHVR